MVADWRFDHSEECITKDEFPKLLSQTINLITFRHIESAFRATGICTFSINSIDFKKLILKKNKLADAFTSSLNDDQSSSSSTMASMSRTISNEAIPPLEYVESMISPQKLEHFKKCDSSPSVHTEE